MRLNKITIKFGIELKPTKHMVVNYNFTKPIAKVEHIRFEKDTLFTTPKQFKKVITDYAVHGG